MSLSSEQVIFYFVRSQRHYTIIVTLPPSLILNKWSFATDKKKTQHEPINAISQQRIDGAIHAPAGACQQKLTKDIGIDEIFE